MMSDTVLWIYIVLLLAGGLMGYLKAKSKVSLITSALFAALLAACALRWISSPLVPDILMGLLLVVFVIRLAKTRKFMPSGMMLGLTALALVLRHVAL
jgi:uncharacterized membrane protein (UPF0136 family)